MRIVKLLLYVFLAVYVSCQSGILVGRRYFDNLSKPEKIKKEALPPFFVVVAFSHDTGKPELIELFEYSALLKEAAAGQGLDDFSRYYGKVVFKEDEDKYSYAIDPAKRESIEDALDWDISFPSIERAEIRLLSDLESPGEDTSDRDIWFSDIDRETIRLLFDQESAGGQRIALYTNSDEFTYKFIYEVNNGHITPIAYGDETKAKSFYALTFRFFPVFIFSMTVFVVLWRARPYITRKVRALSAKLHLKSQHLQE